MTGGDLPRVWRTARHLKPVQVYGRLWFRLARPRPDPSPAPAPRPQSGNWVLPASRRASLIGPRSFRFLRETGVLDKIGWDGTERDKLWRYNQHYFDDLNAEGAADRATWHHALLKDWVARNRPGRGNGWEPYPTSLRIVNWVKWALAGNVLPLACRDSLAIQARWLTRRMEHHLQGNHLFANAKALVFAGLFFDGPEAAGWLRRGQAILARQLPEQILQDGGHFELSTMYHALAVEDMLDLLNLLNAYAAEETLRRAAITVIPGMLRWLAAMCHPDRGIAFFNDAAFGIAPTPAALFDYAARLGFQPSETADALTFMADSGYARLAAGPAVLLADLARIGPDYLPGHAHADTLSFELSLFGRRLVVNSGTSLYGAGPERLRQRGTAAHSTVLVAGEDSSEVWGGFRVGRRARPHAVSVEHTPTGALTATGAHDGYRHLPGAPDHRRRWILDTDALVVEDSVRPAVQAEARYLLAPGSRLEPTGPVTGRITLDSGQRIRWQAQSGPTRLEETSWHPEFGQSVPTQCLVLPLDRGAARLTLDWS